MTKILLIIVMQVIFLNLQAQISGLSASKTTTLSATVVNKNSIEYEPSISLINNENNFEKSFSWRFTYGLLNNFEIGFSVSSSSDLMGVGAKFLFLNSDLVKVASICGVNFNFIEKNPFDNAGLGFVTTFDYTKNFSSDFDFHFMTNFCDNKIISFGFDNGLFVGATQIIIGTNYIYYAQEQKSQFIVNQGVTLEAAKNFLIVATVSLEALRQRTYGFGLALTIKLD